MYWLQRGFHSHHSGDDLLTPGRCKMPDFSTRIPLRYHEREGHLVIAFRSPGSSCGLHDTAGEGDLCYEPAEMKVPDLWGVIGCLIIAFQG